MLINLFNVEIFGKIKIERYIR